MPQINGRFGLTLIHIEAANRGVSPPAFRALMLVHLMTSTDWLILGTLLLLADFSIAVGLLFDSLQ